MNTAALLIALLAQPAPTPQPFASIADKDVNESSGIASSSRRSDLWYTHNDSGDSARFFQFNRQGQIVQTYTVKGVRAIDWEDMASAKLGKESYLYFADFGDNAKARDFVLIHRVVEPSDGKQTELTPTTYRIQYPDGPQNAEALVVDPKDETLWIVAKVNDGASGVYRIRKPKPQGTLRAERVGTYNINSTDLFARLITGASLSPNRKWLALRSYTQIHLFPYGPKWFESKPTTWAAPTERQGEAICFTRDGRSLLTTSEGSPCPITELRLPKSAW